MNAYRITAYHKQYTAKRFEFVVHCNENKNSIARLLSTRGWIDPKVRHASLDDVQTLTSEEHIITEIRQASLREKKLSDDRSLGIIALQKQAAISAREAREKAEREYEQLRDRAQQAAVGDLLALDIEGGLQDCRELIVICNKISLFLGNLAVSKKDILSNVNLAFADFQAKDNCYAVHKMIAIIISAMNEFLTLEVEVSRAYELFNDDLKAADNTKNAISSRSHIFGGSGGGLFLSMLLAAHNVSEDEKHMAHIDCETERKSSTVEATIRMIRLQQQLMNYRIGIGLSLLRAACGDASAIDLNLPAEVERYLLQYRT